MRTPSRAEELGGRERRGAAPRHAVEALGVGDIRGEYGPGRAVIHGRGRAGEGTGEGHRRRVVRGRSCGLGRMERRGLELPPAPRKLVRLAAGRPHVRHREYGERCSLPALPALPALPTFRCLRHHTGTLKGPLHASVAARPPSTGPLSYNRRRLLDPLDTCHRRNCRQPASTSYMRRPSRRDSSKSLSGIPGAVQRESDLLGQCTA